MTSAYIPPRVFLLQFIDFCNVTFCVCQKEGDIRSGRCHRHWCVSYSSAWWNSPRKILLPTVVACNSTFIPYLSVTVKVFLYVFS
jgi:hypothetical protein